jgi:hypothetical protein
MSLSIMKSCKRNPVYLVPHSRFGRSFNLRIVNHGCIEFVAYSAAFFTRIEWIDLVVALADAVPVEQVYHWLRRGTKGWSCTCHKWRYTCLYTSLLANTAEIPTFYTLDVVVCLIMIPLEHHLDQMRPTRRDIFFTETGSTISMAERYMHLVIHRSLKSFRQLEHFNPDSCTVGCSFKSNLISDGDDVLAIRDWCFFPKYSQSH